jgi:hypothetical protein
VRPAITGAREPAVPVTIHDPIPSDPVVALYASARANQPTAHLSLPEIYRRIQAGVWAQPVAHVRRCRQALDAAADPEARAAAEHTWKEAKANLPAVTLSADGQTRARDVALPDRGVVPTGRLQLDLDLHGEPPAEWERLWSILAASPHIESLWRSPSGDGLKGTVLVAGAGDPERHADAFATVDRWLLATIGRANDPAVKDPQRLCFVSHDPDLHRNPAAVELVNVPESQQAPSASVVPTEGAVGPVANLVAVTTAAVSDAVTADSADAIPNGTRNHSLARYAGWLRRAGLGVEEITAALLAINLRRCHPPLEAAEVRTIAASIARYEPDQVTMATVEDWAAHTLGAGPAPHAPPSIGVLVQAKPNLRPVLIDGILRVGETMNVIAAPKVGKSWLVTDLALAVATGRPWLGHATTQRDVLILDNELHGETTAHRVPQVATARGLQAEDYQERLFVENLRGRLTDLFSMAAYFEAIPTGRYGLIVLDAFYRFLPAGSDENDNGTMASLYNAIDRHAERLGCCFALIHHSSKGNQSGKTVTDVGSGAGAQSRATDTHLVLRPHEQDGAVVLDAAVRSWPPPQAQVLRWNFPVWHPADDLDPMALRRERPRRERTATVAAEPTPIQDVTAFAQQVLTSEPLTRVALMERGRQAGWSQRRLEQMLTLAEEQGVAHRWVFGSNRAHAFASVPQPIAEPPEGGGAHALPPHPPVVRTPLEGVAHEHAAVRVPPGVMDARGPRAVSTSTAQEVAHG